MRLYLDTETRSRVDIALGTDLYTRAAECLIVTYAFDEDGLGCKCADPAEIWEPWVDPIPPADLWDALKDPEITVVALNAAFDRLILLRALHIEVPVERWQCAMAQGNAHGLPGSLENLGAVCDLPEHLRKLTGNDYHLIDTFCIPQRATGKFIEPWEKPEEWKRFCDYAIRDTESLRAISLALPAANYSGVNLASWRLDQLVNERGFGFDRALAGAAVSFLGDAKFASDATVLRESQGQVGAATQRDRLLRYLQQSCGIDIANLKASEVTEWLESDDLDPAVRILLEERLQAGKSAGSKFATGLERVGPGDRIRWWSRWNGAGRTGRHSGRGFQPHAMQRPVRRVWRNNRLVLEPVKAQYIDEIILPGIYSKAALTDTEKYGKPYEAIGLAVRHGIVAAPGNELMAGDFKNIESVITAWVAGESAQLEAFASAFENPKDKSRDVYRIVAGKMLGKRPEDVSDSERQMGKVAVLAFGFGGGVSALVNMSLVYQMDLDPLPQLVLPAATTEQLYKAERAWKRAFLSGEDFELSKRVYMACDVLKQQYRAANPAIDTLRRDMDVATKGAVANRGTVYHVGRCTIWADTSMLIIQLPSVERRLIYISPQIKTEKVEDVEGGAPWTSSYITYASFRGKHWRREKAWSGLFVENIVQATANDVLRAAMLRVHRDTLSVPAISQYLMTLPPEARTAISLHVHDEVVLDLPRGSYPADRFKQILTAKEGWMDGLPIAADIWINTRYGKR